MTPLLLLLLFCRESGYYDYCYYPFSGTDGHVARVAECVAELKGIPVAELAALTRDNFYTLFNKAAR